jgi:hypothetical protein
MTTRRVLGTVLLAVGFVCWFGSGIASLFGGPIWDPFPSGALGWGLLGASFLVIGLGSWLRGDDWWEG